MVKEGSASNETAAQQQARSEVDRTVLRVFEKHYQTARENMPPEPAVAVAYSAAMNYVKALNEPAQREYASDGLGAIRNRFARSH